MDLFGSLAGLVGQEAPEVGRLAPALAVWVSEDDRALQRSRLAALAFKTPPFKTHAFPLPAIAGQRRGG